MRNWIPAREEITQGSRRADQQHQQIGDAEVYQEDVCGVSHVFCLQDYDRNLQSVNDEERETIFMLMDGARQFSAQNVNNEAPNNLCS